MIVVIPVSKNDFKDPLSVFNGFTKALRHFGSCEKHELLVVSRPSDLLYAKAIYANVSDLFSKSNIHIFAEDGPEGWPEGPNFYWKNTISHLKEIENDKPWFWMEMDCVPLKRNWVDLLQKEYLKKGKPCLGTIQDTTIVTTDMIRINIAKHLQGTAVYPPKLHEECTIWEYVDRLPKAFDVICQWEIVPRTADTRLIQQGFRTINYKIHHDPFRIQGEDNGDMNGVISYNQPLDPLAVIHHGCKDTSLVDIVTSPEYNYWIKEVCKDAK
jgi:hypothetical protein